MKIGVIGAGKWGTALAISSFKSGNDVILWSYDGNFAKFDGTPMPDAIKITSEMRHFESMDAWIIATPAAYFRETLKKSREFYKGQPIIVCTKGIEAEGYKFMSEILTEELPQSHNYGVLSGPQFAHEVVAGVPTGSTFAGCPATIEVCKQALNNLYLEISDDVIGAEICGVGKNAVALISGYLSIKAKGENEKALMFTRTWNEVMQFGIANNARVQTFLGLCGIGDLFLSATSATSRNYAAGIAIAKQEPIIGTVEGIHALKGLITRAAEQDIPTPVLCQMCDEINCMRLTN